MTITPTNLSAAVQIGIPSYQVQFAATGAQYQPTSCTGSPQSRINFVLGTNVANQINEIYSAILSIAASGTSTINVQSLADIWGNTGVSLVRIKGLLFQLLSTAQDPINGTVCSGVTIGQAGSNPFLMFLTGTTPGMVLGNGEAIGWATPLAAGNTSISGSAKNILITNNDSVNAAAVQVSILGANA